MAIVNSCVVLHAKKTPLAFVYIPERVAHGSDDDIPPPPTASLEMQISQQVLVNVATSKHNQPVPYTQPLLEANSATSLSVEEKDEDREYYHDSSDSLNPSFKSRHSFWAWLGCVLSVAVGISVLFVQDQPIPESAKPRATYDPAIATQASLEAPCCLDSEPPCVGDEGGDRVLQQPCQGIANAATCPPHDICQNGKLVECSHPSFQVDSLIEAKCQLTHAGLISNSNYGLPVFDYDSLKTHPLDVQVLQTNFLVQERERRLFKYIGCRDNHCHGYRVRVVR